MKRFILNLPQFLPSIIVLLVLFYFTLIPQPLPPIQPPFLDFDKVVHIVMFAGVGFTFAFDVARRNKNVRLSGSRLMLICCINIALGGFIELAQGTSLIHRGCDLGDFVADAIGAILIAFTTRPLLRVIFNLPDNS